MERIKIFKKPIPFTCLLVNVFIISNYWFEQLQNERVISNELANDPNKVIDGEIWRLYTCFLTHKSIYQLSLSTYLLVMEGAAFENLIGSVTYFILFVIKMFLVQIIYCVYYLSFKYLLHFDDSVINPIAEGVWMIILSDLVSRSFATPDELRIFKIIPNKYYSLILLIVAFGVSYLGFHVLAIITLAFIEHKLFNGLIFRPYRSHIVCLEKYTCFIIFKQSFKYCFVSVDEVNQNFFRIERSDTFEDIQNQNQQQVNNDSFYANSNQQGQIAVQQSYYSQNVKRWKDDEFDENIHEDVENPQQDRSEVELEQH